MSACMGSNLHYFLEYSIAKFSLQVTFVLKIKRIDMYIFFNHFAMIVIYGGSLRWNMWLHCQAFWIILTILANNSVFLLNRFLGCKILILGDSITLNLKYPSITILDGLHTNYGIADSGFSQYTLTIMTTILDLSTWLISLIGFSVLIHLNRPQSWIVLPQKLLSSGAGHFLGIYGLVVGILSIFNGTLVTGLLGVASGVLLLLMWFRTVNARSNISPDLLRNTVSNQGLKHKFGLWLPRSPQPVIVESILIGSGGVGGFGLEVDLWQPPESIQPSGVGIIYVDIGGWEMRVPDIAIRSTFQHLTGQGHSLVRFRPRFWWQASPGDMVGDIFQAVLWTKDHAESMGVDQNRIVLLGQSAGAHLSLLAAYTYRQSTFYPSDQPERNRSIAGVIGIYPPVEIQKTFEHWGNWSHAGMVFGHSDEVYKRLSPVGYVGEHCPPTLVLHGDHDSVVPVNTSQEMVDALHQVGVPAGFVRFPYAEHIYDMVFPGINPATRVGLYYMDRFLNSI